MNEVDLHCHTTASDGILAPTQVVSRAARLALKVIAITDHDSVDGVAEALDAGPRFRMEVIPGVEINTDVLDKEVHILGYMLNHKQPELAAELQRLREGRIGRAQEMVLKLEQLGAPISYERVRQIAGPGAIGRPHVARTLVEAGYVSTISEAFDRYIGRNRPAYVDRLKYGPAEAVALIRRAGGVPSLAHPVFFDHAGAIRSPFDLDEILAPLVEAGLMGMEAYYPGYDAITTEYLMQMARRHGLLLTGGSDFHGFSSDRNELGSVYVPMKAVRRLLAAWESASQ